MLTALGVGLLPLVLVLWAFFATVLPSAAPMIGHPGRAIVPFVGVGVAGGALGYIGRQDGVRMGFLAAMPGAFVGGALGLLAALEPTDLFLVPVLMAAYILVGILAGWFGSRLRALGAAEG